LWHFFEPRAEYPSCREWHSEWHAARMLKSLAWQFVDVERLLCREQVPEFGDFAA
jgi:hypothetical protein